MFVADASEDEEEGQRHANMPNRMREEKVRIHPKRAHMRQECDRANQQRISVPTRVVIEVRPPTVRSIKA